MSTRARSHDLLILWRQHHLMQSRGTRDVDMSATKVGNRASNGGATPMQIEARKPRSATDLIWMQFRRHKLGVVALFVIAVMTLVSLLAPVISPYDPYKVDMQVADSQPPIFTASQHDHLLGQRGRIDSILLDLGDDPIAVSCAQATHVPDRPCPPFNIHFRVQTKKCSHIANISSNKFSSHRESL